MCVYIWVVERLACPSNSCTALKSAPLSNKWVAKLCLNVCGEVSRLTPDIFNILKKIKPGKNGEIQITDALNILSKKEKVIAYKFNGKRFDCGSVKGYVRATNFLAKKDGII